MLPACFQFKQECKVGSRRANCRARLVFHFFRKQQPFHVWEKFVQGGNRKGSGDAENDLLLRSVAEKEERCSGCCDQLRALLSDITEKYMDNGQSKIRMKVWGRG